MIIFQRRVAGLSDSALAKFVTRASRASGLSGAVNVLITSSQEMRSLNRRFRGKDKPTDVLSFPPLLSFDRFAGDIAIAADIAARSARRLGYSTAQEIKILVLHGVLHLAGYDHQHDQGEMASKEQSLRSKLGLTVGLIERTESPGLSIPTRTAASRRPRARNLDESKAGKKR